MRQTLTWLALMLSMCSCDVVSSGATERPPSEAAPVVPDVEVARAALTLLPAQGRWTHQGRPFSGYAVRRHASGTISERMGFVQGKREGLATQYYPNGAKRKRSSYRNNRLDGAVSFWSPAGLLLSETHYARGRMHGTQKLWYPSGARFKHRNLAHGREHGMQRAWRRSGKLYVNYEARDGRIFGLKRSTLCFSLEDERVVKK